MKIGDVFKSANGSENYATIVGFPERTVSMVTGKTLAKPIQDVLFKTRKNNRGRWGAKEYQMPMRQFRLEFTALMLALVLALLPGIAFAQFLGYSQPNGLGGWNYYGSPNAGYDNAMATRNFIDSMRMLQQQQQFNRQMEIMQQEMDMRERAMQRQYRPRMSSGTASQAAPQKTVHIELRNPYGFGTE